MPPELRRVLGPFDATCVVIGAIVGVGIFFTPGTVARLAGSGGLALAAWGVGGIIALCGAYAFAELGGLYPRTAGQYEILRDCFGAYPASLFVICSATVILPGSAALIAIICAQNIGVALFGTLPDARAAVMPAVLLTAALTVANALGTRRGAAIQNVTVVAKMAAIAAIVVLATIAGRASVFGAATDTATEAVAAAPAARPAFGVIGAIFAALVPAFFSYGGWQQVLWVGGEVRDPERTLPRAITVGVLVVVAVYMLVNWAYLRLLGPVGVASSPVLAADAVAAGWPGAGSRVVAGAVAISAFGVLNVQFLSGPRLVHGLAADGRLPRALADVSPRFGTPIPAILQLGAVTLGLLLVVGLFGARPIDQLTTGVVFVDCIFFILTGLALFVLRRRRPDAMRPVRVPLYPLVPLVFVLGETAILIGAYLDADTRAASLIGLAWIAIVTVAWMLRGRRGSTT